MSGIVPVVLVGVDGSAESCQALRWAVRYASLAGAAVRAVIAWQPPIRYGYYGYPSGFSFGLSAQQLSDAAAATLAATVGEVSGDKPAVVIDQQVVEGHPAEVLLEEARSAELLVIGPRGHGAFTGLLLGSVTIHCVHHAPCAVVVARETAITPWYPAG